MDVTGQKKILHYYGALVICAVLLLLPAIYNGYPLVNPDTATYLASGFKPETPFDRPIAYGLLIRLFSLNGLSLWLVVFAQGYIVSWLIMRVFRAVMPDRPYIVYTITTTLILALFTPLSWVVSQVQPDVFTSIATLCAAVLLIGKETKWNIGILYFLFFISVGTHMSHPVLFCAVFLFLFIFVKLFTTAEHVKRARITLGAATALSLAAIVFMGSAMSKSKHVFFTGSLLEKGVLKTYLDDQCAQNSYAICAYKDALPHTSDDFIWNDNSPLYKIGAWAGTKKEFNKIDHDIVTTPKYLWLFIKATAAQADRQAITFNIGDGNTPMPVGCNVQNRIAEYFPREIGQFDHDKQNMIGLNTRLSLPNIVFIVITIVSLLIILIRLVSRQKLSTELRILLTVTISTLILNVADCAAFTTVIGRYGCKMIWLIPLCAIFLLFQGKVAAKPIAE